jgi:hypothetical protein
MEPVTSAAALQDDDPAGDADEQMQVLQSTTSIGARRRAEKYLNLLTLLGGLKGKALNQAIASWNAENPDMPTSLRSYYRIKKDYEKKGVRALVGQWGRNKGRALSIEALGEIGAEAYARFRDSYLSDSRPSASSCREIALAYAVRMAERVAPETAADVRYRFPDEDTFVRAVYSERGAHFVYRLRMGEEAANRKYGNAIIRDDSDVRAGDVWVSDHHQIDNLWIAGLSGREIPEELKGELEAMRAAGELDGATRRPWLTAWRDYKTGKWLSWMLRFADPNSERIMETFAEACTQYGLPKTAIMDNGKDYRCYDFAGGRRTIHVVADPRQTRSMLAVLGVEALFAWPYHGQSKPIERDFGTFISWLAKHAPGYTGKNAGSRPESLAHAVKRGALWHVDEGIPLVNMFITDIWMHRASQGKNLRGKSRAELWEQEFAGNPTVRPDTLALLRMRTTGSRLIQKNGVRYGGHYWWGEWMEQHKSSRGEHAFPVYLRIPQKDITQEAFVFHAETDAFLGRARCDVFVAPGIARDGEQRLVLEDKIALRRQIDRSNRVLSKIETPPDAEDVIRTLAAATVPASASGYIVQVNDDAVGLELAEPAIDVSTGEVLAEAGTVLTDELVRDLVDAGIASVRIARTQKVTRATRFDHVHRQDAEMQASGTYGITVPPPAPAKPKYHFWKSDREGGQQ